MHTRCTDILFMPIDCIGEVEMFNLLSYLFNSILLAPQFGEMIKHRNRSLSWYFPQISKHGQLFISHSHVLLIRLLILPWFIQRRQFSSWFLINNILYGLELVFVETIFHKQSQVFLTETTNRINISWRTVILSHVSP